MAAESEALPTDYWQQLGVRLALAGGLFPVVTGAVIWLPMGLIGLAISVIGSPDWGSGVLWAAFFLVSPVIYGPAMFAAGYIYTAMIAMAVLPLVAGTLRLAGLRMAADRGGTVVGALVAWSAMSPVGVGACHYALLDQRMPSDWFWWTVGVVLGVFGIAAGMAAGSLAGLAALRRRATRGEPARPAWLGRVSLRVLLVAMAPLSVAMAIAKAFGQLGLGLAIYAAGGTVTVWLLRRPVQWAVNAWLERSLRRRRERRRRPAERST